LSVAVAAEPRVLHATPGRIRVHIPDWPGHGQRTLEARLRAVAGVLSAQANTLTANVLIRYDPARTGAAKLVDALRSLLRDGFTDDTPAPAQPHVVHERSGHTGRARIAVRGLDRNPAMVRQVVDHYCALPGVKRVTASVLTGRILVEYSRNEIEIEDLLDHLADIELPEVEGEDEPDHPLDPAPLVHSSVRTAGATLGLGLLGAGRLTGLEVSPGFQAGAAQSAAAFGIVQSFPIVRSGLRRLLGPLAADLALYIPGIAVLTLSGSPLGLVLAAAESFRLLTEVLPRRAAWRRYEAGLETVAQAHPGDVIRLESGDRTPVIATVIEGYGTASGRDGLPLSVEPEAQIPAGARCHGGPFVLQLQAEEPFSGINRPAPVKPSGYDRYLRALSPMSLGYAALTGLITRSFSRAIKALLLVNARPAIIGKEAADTGASARVLRAGVTVIGSRRDRTICLPHALLFDGVRTLTDGLEMAGIVPLGQSRDTSEIATIAAGVMATAGAPWGSVLSQQNGLSCTDGRFDGRTARAQSDGTWYTLGPIGDHSEVPPAVRLRAHGEHLLFLRAEGEPQSLGVLFLRPRLAPGVPGLVATCVSHGVKLGLVSAGNSVATNRVAERAGIPVVAEAGALEAVRSRQADGSLVAVVSDGAHAGPVFEACDLAIGLSSGRSSHFPARADLLAPDVNAVTAIVEAGARRRSAMRESVAISGFSNLVGVFLGFQGELGLVEASYSVYLAALGAIAGTWYRLRGGDRARSTVARLVDPRPERWGRRSVDDTLRVLKASSEGLSNEQALERRRVSVPLRERGGVAQAILDQIRSPLTGILAVGAGLSFLLGSPADVVIIGATIAANVLVGAWQERQAGQAIAALESIGTSSARVLRDGEETAVPADEVVPGDILVLASGDRVAADARIMRSRGLEVDEAALTGESLPVPKHEAGGTDSSRIVLAGSDVTVGTALAVVVAVGPHTRMGAMAAALALDEMRTSPLGVRLNRMMRRVLPVIVGGGLLVVLSGLLRRRPFLPQLAVGASIAVAAVPEGLPLLAGVGEVAVARRLAGRDAVVRRLAAVEALGRVDVACTDKTGTLTAGRLALTLVSAVNREARPSRSLRGSLHRILHTGSLATPHPEAADALVHPTDVAVAEAAELAGLGETLLLKREKELAFDPSRSFHAAVVHDRMCLKGAVEALLPRCDRTRVKGRVQVLDDAGREDLLERAHRLAGRGLRILMVAEGSTEGSLEDPGNLVALGFLGLSDPLRPEVPAAVRRCHEAGVRVIMLTGDHPATAASIAREAGLNGPSEAILTGSDIAALHDDELDERLEHATVVARVTPLDKLRIVESLQRRGHTVAMTGDGVNDAPALRLADVGVAMGRRGTEVARQAADVVLTDDNFSTLVEALVEGRSFWRNIRRALGLLLGGNLGELGMVAGASLLGTATPLLSRQILVVNMVTDIFPSLAVALQPPESRHLASLSREGTAALGAPLWREVRRRGLVTAVPSLAAFLLALRSGDLIKARSVAFAGLVSTELAQTLQLGRVESGHVTRAVTGAVAASFGVLALTFILPPLRGFLGLAVLDPAQWALVGAAALVAGILGGGVARPVLPRPAARLLASPVPV
jgi:calcium-translocating P-type ATPase